MVMVKLMALGITPNSPILLSVSSALFHCPPLLNASMSEVSVTTVGCRSASIIWRRYPSARSHCPPLAMASMTQLKVTSSGSKSSSVMYSSPSAARSHWPALPYSPSRVLKETAVGLTPAATILASNFSACSHCPLLASACSSRLYAKGRCLPPSPFVRSFTNCTARSVSRIWSDWSSWVFFTLYLTNASTRMAKVDLLGKMPLRSKASNASYISSTLSARPYASMSVL
mmetsp:Transcript_29515/g.49623  ORF Transcript_29515/g.49623 Transcript_29515/m.49623 type:complete len:229 (+) Transcript_29515:571-1257(+)